MNAFKSIKWRLQLWYGLILVAVLAGLGVTSYQLERNRLFRRVDDGIHRRIGALVQQLHRPPHGPMPGRPPEDRRPPPDFPDEGMRPHGFSLSPETATLFNANDPSQFYFIIRGRDGKEIARSTNAPVENISSVQNRPALPENAPPDGPEGLRDDREPRPERGDREASFAPNQAAPQMRGSFREILTFTPSQEMILVGRSVKGELEELDLTALELAGFGAVILLAGLAGGWWFVGRALRPISAISSTAAKISAGDLSQRINLAEAESELGELAAVLNSTFARLETAFAQQKQFASDAAHELRTPVSVILTQTQMVLNRERDAAGYKLTVEACQRAAQRMRKLIESLLELARFDAGQEVLKRLKFDFSKTLSDCTEMVQPLADERRVKIISELAPLEMAGDSERLAQVVTNLLTNAIQYNQPEGVVRMKLAGQGGLAVLEISNTGAGIAPDDLPRVFERFYRADKSRTGGGSAGLGLSICKAIVEAHGGTIEVSSKLNAETNFRVCLPVGG